MNEAKQDLKSTAYEQDDLNRDGGSYHRALTPSRGTNTRYGDAEVTQLLDRIRAGESRAEEELFRTVYKELRRRAGYYMRYERPGHVLQPTALVNEAYLRLVKQRDTHWQNRAHFFAIAAVVMRRVLVDIARHDKVSGKSAPVSDIASPDVPSEILAVHEALTRLAAIEPNHAKALELKYFGGLTNAEIGESIGISEGTVEKYLRRAKAWLRTQLEA